MPGMSCCKNGLEGEKNLNSRRTVGTARAWPKMGRRALILSASSFSARSGGLHAQAACAAVVASFQSQAPAYGPASWSQGHAHMPSFLQRFQLVKVTMNQSSNTKRGLGNWGSLLLSTDTNLESDAHVGPSHARKECSSLPSSRDLELKCVPGSLF